MKNTAVLFLSLFVCTSIFSQSTLSVYGTNGSKLETNFYNQLSTEIKNNARDFTGSPFIEENLQPGTLLLKGGKVGEGEAPVYYMRYNVLEQRIEFSSTNDLESLKMLPKNSSIVVHLDGKTYQYININNLTAGYYEIVNEFDEHNQLVVGHIKNVHKVEQQNSYNSSQKSRIRSSKRVYFLNNKNTVEIENHKRKSIKAFSTSSQSVLKKYIKQNNIKFDDDYQGLIAVINKYLAL
jgi:hypothetical protein